MSDENSNIHRRGFLSKITVGAAALGLAKLASPLSLNAQEKKAMSKGTDHAFEAWLGKIKGKHKQVFDSPMPEGGMPPFGWTRVFLMTNESTGVASKDVTAVLILRHESIPLAMGHSLWEKYSFGEMFKITDSATKAPAIRHPFYQPKEGELPLPGIDVESLLKSGVLIGVCDMALTFYSKFVFAPKMNMDADAIKKEWVAGIIPGIQIVPSGVLAVNRAQEHGCTYCFAG